MKDNWKEKLNKFLEDFKYKADIIGILACGSYITGNPTSHSDLDVHIVLNDSCNYRVKTNKIIDGLLIECFINPPKQIRAYFKEDYVQLEQSSMNQFATGEIIRDDTGIVSQLKEEARELISQRFKDVDVKFSELTKYAVWDNLDDLEDALKEKRKDFDFIYFNYLDSLLSLICKFFKFPYGRKIILKSRDKITKQKYMLPDFPDLEISGLITKAIVLKSKKYRLKIFKQLCTFFWKKTGGFDIDKFEFKSKVAI